MYNKRNTSTFSILDDSKLSSIEMCSGGSDTGNLGFSLPNSSRLPSSVPNSSRLNSGRLPGELSSITMLTPKLSSRSGPNQPILCQDSKYRNNRSFHRNIRLSKLPKTPFDNAVRISEIILPNYTPRSDRSPHSYSKLIPSKSSNLPISPYKMTSLSSIIDSPPLKPLQISPHAEPHSYMIELKILELITEREELLNLLDLSESEIVDKSQLNNLIDQYREITLTIIQHIQLWRNKSIRKINFEWNGRNYLEKIYNDFNRFKQLETILDYPLYRNPFLYPPTNYQYPSKNKYRIERTPIPKEYENAFSFLDALFSVKIFRTYHIH